MNTLTLAIWSAAAIQLIIAGANLVVAHRLDYRGSVARLTPIVRQVFVVHAVYIVLVILWFALLCLLFAAQLAGGSPLARFITAGLAVFWGLRAAIHLTIYDKEVRRRYRAEDVAFLLACGSLTAIFLAAALQ